VDSAGLRAALAGGHEMAYVTRLARDGRWGTTCLALTNLRLVSSWLSTENAMAEHVTPLVETRARAIVRRGRVGLSVDSAGSVALDFGPPPQS
jgi:hypothetical protein